MARLSVMLLLDRLEETLSGRFRMAGRAWVDTESAMELVEKIRSALPDEIREAEWLTSEKERLLLEAQEEAKRMLRDAENYSAKLVQDSIVRRKAEQEAEIIMAEARQEAAAMEEEARTYAQRVMGQLAENLEKTMRVIRMHQDDME